MVRRSLWLAMLFIVGISVGAHAQTAPAGYFKIFGDDFNSNIPITNKWFTRLVEGGGTAQYLPSNGEQQRYWEYGGVHSFSDCCAKLTALPSINGIYPSAALRSKQLIDLNGPPIYLEARIKIPSYKGAWLALWLRADAKPDGSIPWPPELDIMELVRNATGDDTTKLHVGGKSINWPGAQNIGLTWAVAGWNNQWQFWQAPYDFANDFHVFALDYDKDRSPNFIILVDGAPIVQGNYLWRYDDGSPAVGAHIIIDHAIGGGWAGRDGIDEVALATKPALEIDWVYVYQKATFSTVGQDLLP